MSRIVSAAAIGLVFGTGMAISGMANPAKVINFFDLAGDWDPSLALVMASALLVSLVGYRLVFRRPAPILAERYQLPTARNIDLPLIAGSALFGVGWGIAGFCPGGAIPALGLGEPTAFLFVAAMLTGMAMAGWARGAWRNRTTPALINQRPA